MSNRGSDHSKLLNFSMSRSVPLIMQSEVSECGLAALAMIASYHGYKSNIHTFRNIFKIDSQGLTIKQLIEIANGIGLSARAIKCEVNELKNLSCPCIIHWNMDHFVVLTKVNKKSITINDPAIGKRVLSYSEVDKFFTGIVLELFKNEDFKTKNVVKKIGLSNFWGKIYGLKSSLIIFFSLSLILQSIALLSPYYMQWVVDNVLLSNDKPLLIVLSLGFILVHVLSAFVKSLRGWIIIRFNSLFNIQIGSNIFYHLIGLPSGYFDKRHVGDILSRFESINSIRHMMTTGIIEALLDGIMTVLVLVMMFLYNTTLSMISTTLILILFLAKIAFYYPKKRITEELIVNSSIEQSCFIETVRSMQTIKLFCSESLRQNLWINKYAKVINSEIISGKIGVIEDLFHDLLLGIESIIIIYFGALDVMNNTMTVGMLLAFLAYKSQFVSNSYRLADRVISFRLVGLYFERLSDIVLSKRELDKNDSEKFLFKFSESIELSNISYKYSDNSNFVLKNISFSIPKGKCIAIVGPSGCGKSTLLKIILGLIEPLNGKILVDNIDSKEIIKKDYRMNFGSVSQDDTLLSGTIMENITMFDTNIDEERFVNCCKIACIWDDIETLPMGVNSLVGDMGNFFSGGQLQRIFLARALYKEPRVLCLDESTSNLDVNNERNINKNLRKLDITKIIIAHRKETIDSADIVIDMNSFK